MNLGIFLGIGESLSQMDKSGQKDRFIKLYLKKYAKDFEKVYLFTYAKESCPLPKNVILIPNTANIHRYLYCSMISLLHRKYINKCDVIRGFGLTSAIPALLTSKPFTFNWPYEYSEFLKIDKKYVLIPIFKVLEAIAFARANRVFIATKSKFKTLTNPKFIYIPNGVDLKIFNAKTTGCGLIFVGRLEKQKNLFFLIDAVSRLKKHNRRITMLGSGSQEEELKEYAKQKKVSLNILPPISNTKLPLLLKRFSVLALPSLAEGSPKVLLEAMVLGLVPVVTGFSTAYEVVKDKDNGFITKYDPTEYANKISELLENDNLVSKMSKRAQNTISDSFDLSKILNLEIKHLKAIAVPKSNAILYFGSFDPDYSRNRIIRKGLIANGFKVTEDRASGIIFSRYLKLTRNFYKNRKQISSIIVGFPGHLDVPLAVILGKLFRKKVFYDIFASTYETYVLDREVVQKKSLKSKFYYFVDWIGLKLADYIIVDTIAHGKFYNQLYGVDQKKQIVVYVGSDTDYFYPRNLEEETDVLFYGSYQPLQGVEVIIKAADELPNIHFKMIGNGQTRKSAEDLAKNLKLKNVEFVNWLPLEELSEEISKAKICLGIFGSSPKANVVIPNKVYDYAACGKPIITVENRAIREIFQNNHDLSLVTPGEAALARGIINLIKSPGRRRIFIKETLGLFNEKLKHNIIVAGLVEALNDNR